MTLRHRDVAQLGSALPWGGRGRQFKSDRSDHEIYTPLKGEFLFLSPRLTNYNCLILDK